MEKGLRPCLSQSVIDEDPPRSSKWCAPVVSIHSPEGNGFTDRPQKPSAIVTR